MTTSIAPLTVFPPDDPADLDALSQLIPRLSPNLGNGVSALVSALAQGEPVRVEPFAAMLTTTQAAEILNVSRMTLVKLLEDGKIPYEQPNVHRLVRLGDVLAYKEEQHRVFQAYLEESMRQAQEDGTFDIPADEFMPVLEEIRHGKRS